MATELIAQITNTQIQNNSKNDSSGNTQQVVEESEHSKATGNTVDKQITMENDETIIIDNNNSDKVIGGEYTRNEDENDQKKGCSSKGEDKCSNEVMGDQDRRA